MVDPWRGLPGAIFRPVAFEPAFHKYRGRLCRGVQVHVSDPARFRPFAPDCTSFTPSAASPTSPAWGASTPS